MEQREVDNMLLSMIQKHFPSLPLSDEHTDWGKWLGFARAVYEAGRASPASVPGWKLVPDVPTSTMVLAGEKALSEHDFLRMDSAYCAMLATAPATPVSEDRKDAERYRWLIDNSFNKGITQFHVWKHTWEPHSKTGEQIEWKQRISGPSLDAAIDAAMQEVKP